MDREAEEEAMEAVVTVEVMVMETAVATAEVRRAAWSY